MATEPNKRDIEICARAAWEAGRLKQAFRLFQKGAKLGRVGCMLDLGYFYDEGIGTVRSEYKALKWYKKAYKRGSAAAASNIAINYRDTGKYQTALSWFVRAACLDDGDACLDIAKLYVSGQGVKRSFDSASEMLHACLKSQCVTEASKEEAQDMITSLSKDLTRSSTPAPIVGGGVRSFVC